MVDPIDSAYTFCASAHSVAAALDILYSVDVLAFDCEAMSLGDVGGKLSIISLRTIQPKGQTFLFDVTKLKPTTLLPIYDILESVAIQKVVYDGRKDFSCLYHDHQVKLCNVIDLQLADVWSRNERGEGEVEQMKRLSSAVWKNTFNHERHLYTSIHKLNGLTGAAKEHIGFVQEKGPRFDHSQWLKRPLPVEYVRHAVEDVRLIHELHDHFSAKGYLYDDISVDSDHYVSVWQDKQTIAADAYRNHGFLLLDILDRDEGETKGACGYCERLMPKSCFSTSSWRSKNLKCLVCRAVERMPPWTKRR